MKKTILGALLLCLVASPVLAVDPVERGDGVKTAEVFYDGLDANFDELEAKDTAQDVTIAGKQDTDADLADLADGSLTGSKVGAGINADNIDSGTVDDARIAATIARDSEIPTNNNELTNGSGYLVSYTETDPTVNTLGKATLPCSTTQIAKWNGSAWACADDEIGATGTGDITGVTAGTGLSGGGDTGAVTVNLANTAVSPGSYAAADITVDAQGRVTAASNGSVGAGDMLAVNNLSEVDPGSARINLGVVPGTDVQQYDAALVIYSGITPSADIQGLLGSPTYAALRATLDLETGVDFYSTSAVDNLLTSAAIVTKLADQDLSVRSIASTGTDTYMGVSLGENTADTNVGNQTFHYTSDVLNWKSEAGVDKILAFSDSNVATATALAADPTDCSAGSYAVGINASGTAQGCTDASTEIDSSIVSERTATATLTGKTFDNDVNNFNGFPVGFCVAASDETTDLTTGTAKVTFRSPWAFTLTVVRASVTTAPTGATLTVDINEGGTTILSTILSLDVSELTSVTAATPPVISDSSIADDALMTIDVDQIGSTVAGAGLKVCLYGTRDL